MKASVIIPTYNDDLRLAWVLAGLAQQTVNDFEAIVVNDGGDDSTARLCAEFATMSVQYLALPQSDDFRAGVARNEGVRHSTGDLLIFLDCDAVPAPNLVEVHLANVNGNQFGCGRSVELAADLVKPLETFDFEALQASAAPDTLDPRANFFVSRHCSVPAALFCEIGGFDETIEGYGWEDGDLLNRMACGMAAQPVNLCGLTVVVHLGHEPRGLGQGRRTADDVPQLRGSNPFRNGGPLVRQTFESAAIIEPSTEAQGEPVDASPATD